MRKQKHGIRRIEGLLHQEGISASKRKIIRVLKQHGLHNPSPEKGRHYSYSISMHLSRSLLPVARWKGGGEHITMSAGSFQACKVSCNIITARGRI